MEVLEWREKYKYAEQRASDALKRLNEKMSDLNTKSVVPFYDHSFERQNLP